MVLLSNGWTRNVQHLQNTNKDPTNQNNHHNNNYDYLSHTEGICFQICSGIFGSRSVVLLKIMFLIKRHLFFLFVPPRKTMQNHVEITSTSQLWTRNVRSWTKSLNLDMSGPAKASPGGQVHVSKMGFSFVFLQKLHLSIFISKLTKMMQNHADTLSQSRS